ncbi:PDZ domain-containing protein [Nitrospiraceae bacterium HYJII51-Mn-bac16s-1-B09]|uniref:PDZ domain-containing protein n=2 Tax=Candidatus Manganitrophus noduliformans TaxID=2606439 RepID=A0A7X6DSM1_9BACT|nr:PDZ domain-containing protein [Candidatus Manganitrophus noduliformans]
MISGSRSSRPRRRPINHPSSHPLRRLKKNSRRRGAMIIPLSSQPIRPSAVSPERSWWGIVRPARRTKENSPNRLPGRESLIQNRSFSKDRAPKSGMSIQRCWTAALLFSLLFVLFSFSTPSAFVGDEENTIEIYQRVNASVVNITSIAVTYDFFLNPIPSEASGSGSVIDKKGYILTNNHVIRDSERLEITLADGSKWPGELVGSDPQTDLAVIKVNAPPERLTAIPMGNSDGLRPGQKVLAIGNPFGLERTLTAGIISSVRKNIRAGDLEMDEVIQIDAAINPGNSGGPLLNSEGKMVGINTAIFTPSGGSVGIGFAIPINTAKRILNELITKGYVAYAWIGIDTQTLLPEFAEALSLPVRKGVMVARVVRGGPAHRAGIRGGTQRVEVGNAILVIGGDILVAVDGEEVASAEAFHQVMKSKRPGDKVRLILWRGREKREVEVKLGERPRRGR